MRRFLLLAHRVPVSGAFTLNDLAGGAGRMDEIARAVSTAFTLSNDLRRDTEVTILFSAEAPPRARRIDLVGGRLRYLNPDERSTAALLKNALVRSSSLETGLDASPGLRVGPADPPALLAEFVRAPDAFWLTEKGGPLRDWRPGSTSFSAVVSDPLDPTWEEVHLLEAAGVPRVSLGPRSMRTSQCVDVLHYEFDRREGARPAAPGAESEPS
ncbi:MAG TPA: tRNA (pseudouridine(54)-N(1))-methyltransferase TrmY [Thermoplasmata archaeon]|nr:tRNA (pseudouridine(54)-N(1))-methyltransferase TrmY [Thermoplasmata archaeon]